MAMPSARSGLLRANLTVTSGTALSRVTGLIRIIIFGIVIGQTALADAYDIANNAPNVVYELLLGGILTATLVPLFTRYLHDGDDESINAITSFAFVALAVITTIAIMLAPLIFKIFSLNPADTIDADLFGQAGTVLTRLLLLQIFFYGVTSICTSILHARKQFFAAAWSPVLANLVTITSLLFVSRVSSVDPPTLEEIVENSSLQWLLGMGSTSGIIVMALALVFALRRSGTSLKFKFNRTHDAVRQLLKLSGWAVAYIAANQVTLVVIKNLATPGSGNVDAYSKAYTFFSLPHGLLAVSIATTFVPELARAVAQNNRHEFDRRFFSGLRLTAIATIPASIILVLFAKPIVAQLLQYGNFDASATTNTARALTGLAVGLSGFSIYLFVLRGFYSHGDTRTPFFINLFENALNVVFAIALVKKYDVLGLGLAFSFAYLISSVIAFIALRRKIMNLPPIIS
ncbi:MAG: murein biosynthesis integral membrane protein MurJ [Actinobacteria bacterium]|nr:murein biosynthesis integral membrane protein MurJ [Actinomycetota bacterium]NDA37369.1 murein biosynthesis integral membrane protein MurJ [Acidimicrobiia bacterium]NDB26755.1 murein biosynthesis integral membrane protein MurJ [Actinomycetota bacterium]NDF87939.1 murein biosynthesis integral membrane protein MurJ [Actinomycetota bacterium]